jgi:hypothetical protein
MSLLTDLRRATKGLLFLSESDAPLVAFVWKGVRIDSAAVLLAHLKKPADTPVTEVTLEAFFAPMTTPQSWHDDDARAELERFMALVGQLAALQTPRVYRLGAGPDVLAYCLGTTPDGHTAGVSTQLTET